MNPYKTQKKSREESSGAGSGVEIIVNEPYSGGPGGCGQYTRKIYHVGSHLPGWIKGLLPKSALTVEEEAWNAYPYTKTRYTCPFVEKFSLEIETYYFADNGNQENVFQLSGQELRNRAVDLIDVVTDQTYAAEYNREEDPKLFVSEKTGRGPLADTWLEEHWAAVEGRKQPTADNKSLMCAYKLCRVEFRYWGMQTKLERFIHDTGIIIVNVNNSNSSIPIRNVFFHPQNSSAKNHVPCSSTGLGLAGRMARYEHGRHPGTRTPDAAGATEENGQ